MIEAPAPAKLNFGLHVLRRRADGYHDIDTVFVRIPWSDRIRVSPADGISMTCTDPSLPTDERNLCMRAALALRAHGGCRSGARIELAKAIPHGAGLGGGSSDAATTLRLLDRLWGLGTADRDLQDLGTGLGSDVPFFLGPPVARGTGRGEVLEPISMPAALDSCRIIVAVPPVTVSTAAAYGMVTPRADDRESLVPLLERSRPALWQGRLTNDFQGPVRSAEPLIGDALDLLLAGGAEYASLSGSGSAVFGCFTTKAAASVAESSLSDAGCRTWSGIAGDPPDAFA